MSDIELYVPDWLAREKRIGTRPKGKIKEETDKAILFKTEDFPKLGEDKDKVVKEVWLPKSQINILGGG